MGAFLRKYAVFAVLLCVACNAHANSHTTDQSDLWFVASESGWGMQLVQRDTVIFATLFVYGQGNEPTWYVATMQRTGSLNWSGPLYATTGPWFAAVPFNPSSVTATPVGTMTWSAPFVEQGTVTYTVNGISVTKNVVRQTLVQDDFSGTFGGAIHGTSTSCFNPSNSITAEGFAAFAVVQSGQNVTFGLANESGSTCTFTGTVSQSGQYGKILGNYTCSVGEAGTFNIFEMTVGLNSIQGRFSLNSTNNGCQSTGYFGGIRHR